MGDVNTNAIEDEKALNVTNEEVSQNEVDILLHDDIFNLLRMELKDKGIFTISKLKNTKLWVFMNQYNIYTIGTRQLVFSKIQNLLQSNETSKNGKLKLTVEQEKYIGNTPSEAFLHFCEEMSSRFPLKIRNLIGKSVTNNDLIPLHKYADQNCSLKMSNPSAYIKADLTASNVISATDWICKMCNFSVSTIKIDKNIIHKTSNSSTVSSINIMQEDKAIYQKKNDIEKTQTVVSTVNNKVQIENSIDILPQIDNLLIQKAEQLVLKADLEGLSYNELNNMLKQPVCTIKKTIADSKHIVEINDKLIHENAFIDWDEGAERLEIIVEKLMKKNDGYISAAQLYEYAHFEMNMFLNDNDINNETAVYYLAKHLFKKTHYHNKSYFFVGNMHISKLEDAIESNFDIFRKYALNEGGVFHYSELVDYLSSIKVKTNNLRKQLRLYNEPHFMYYDEDVIIASECIEINDDWKNNVKKALNILFDDVGDHIILREIQPDWFDRLPELLGGRKWTPMFLQSVLRFYSDELGARTIIAMETQGIDTLHTMMVKNDSPIQNFGDVVVSYIVESNISERTFEAEDLRGLLCKSGIISGNELMYNMNKALGKDERFAWDTSGNKVTIRV